MFEETKVKYVHDKEVWCEGESTATGHPRVFMEMGIEDEIVCPYCSMKFVYTAK